MFLTAVTNKGFALSLAGNAREPSLMLRVTGE